jgi:hypothetical protein
MFLSPCVRICDVKTNKDLQLLLRVDNIIRSAPRKRER